MHRERTAAIMLPTLVAGDATGADALGMSRALKEAGWGVRIFANEIGEGMEAEPISRARRFLERHHGLVIYHQGTQWAEGIALLDRVRGRLIIRDHNVTPPHFFEGISAGFLEVTQAGADTRAALAQKENVDLFLPCSTFSGGELRDLGVVEERIAIVPPFHEISAIEERTPDPHALRRWSRDPADILFVSRLAPNKGQRRLIRISAVYRELFGTPLRVRLVGRRHPKLRLWERVLRRDAARLGVSRAIDIVGDVTPEELKAAYLSSHVFVCCSEHEGFCVPLVEAAWLGLPVVATDQPAVSETLGATGLIFGADDDDAIALMLRRLLTSPQMRERITAAQQTRMKTSFTYETLAERFLGAVENGTL